MDRKVEAKIAYVCPICKQSNFDEKVIEKCADEHVEVVGFAVKYSSGRRFPVSFWITYSDGSHSVIDISDSIARFTRQLPHDEEKYSKVFRH